MNDIIAIVIIAFSILLSYVGVAAIAWYMVDQSYQHRLRFLDNAITAREDFFRHTMLRDQKLTTKAPVPRTEAAHKEVVAMTTQALMEQTFDGDEDDPQTRNRVRSVTDVRKRVPAN